MPRLSPYLVTTLASAAALGVAGTASAAEPGDDRAGLLLEYHFDGDLEDSSGAGNHGRLTGAASFAEGHAGQCLAFDGSGQFLEAATNLPALKDTFTVECWVRPAASQRPYADILGNHHNDFAGFALQQDGSLTNRYYFTFGTGTAWVYSRTIELAAGVWQHVAAVKTPGRLRVYVNGMLADSRKVAGAMATSPTPFMVALGIAAQPRWFAGEIDEVRVWDRARPFRPLLSETEQVELFAKTGAIESTSSSRWGLFAPGEGNTLGFGLDPERVPASVDRIMLAFDCRDCRGAAVPFAASLELRREAEFRGGVAVPGQAGYRRLSWQPSFFAAGQNRSLPAGALSFLVLAPQDGIPAPVQTAPPATPAPADGWLPPTVLALDGPEWRLAVDSTNCGRDQQWWQRPTPEARATKVPWIIQDAFPGYHGVAWYWREFAAPANPHPGGRYLLRFWAVDYTAEVWLNGVPVGGHEGGETPFVPNAANRLAVRVLNPTHEPIDGLTLNQTPRRAKVIPYSAGASYNHGGIVDSVELLAVPATSIEDLYLRPDVGRGAVRVEVSLRRSAAAAGPVRLDLSLAPDAGGETLQALALERDTPPGQSVIEAELPLAAPHRWELNDPFLYRVTARVAEVDSRSCDERSARCGFRDFRVAGGHFRLNGRRLYLRSTHTVNATPVGQQVPHDPDLFRRDLFYLKVMGFNCIRFIWGGATRAQLDLCDELGLLVYAESAAANPMADTPQMPERFDRSVAEMIRRDRNHPSVVIWGLLNETFDGPVFRHATQMLPLVRSLDETRVVALNSGRWDGCLDIGSFCNPDASGWDCYLGAEAPDGDRSRMTAPGGYCLKMGDVHAYPRVPHTADTLRFLRTLGQDTGPVFLSEYGIGSAVDLWRVTRHFEQLGKPDAEDAQFYRERLDRFLADWERWRLADTFAGPDEFFAESLRKMAGQRTLGLNAIRANPAITGHSLTGMMDHVNCGEGLFTLFRELKPGTVDALFEAFAPLRLCLFAESATIVRGGTVHLDAVLANEDALPPGEYPVHLQVVGLGMERPLDRTVNVVVPAREGDREAPFALPFFAEDLAVDGPGGRYRFRATMERGGAPTGGEAVFYVDDPATMPAVETEILLWGEDADLARWLGEHGIRCRPVATPDATRQVVLVGSAPAAGGQDAWRGLFERIARGDTVVFLSPGVFREADNPVARVPLPQPGSLTPIYGWLYLKDEWSKRHPIFAGLQAGGLMDYTLYRELIPDLVFAGQEPPAEAVAGAIKASQDYASGLMLSVHALGAGRFVLNTLLIRENLGKHPLAERLLRNLLRYAAADAGKPAADLAPEAEAQLRALGYR
jgi:hypothetical protein